MTRLGICSVFKNEASNLAEWVRFHQDQGFTRFYLFDDKSTDDWQTVLEPFVRDGSVTVGTTNDNPIFTLGRPPAAFTLGLKAARGESDWVAFIDTDEFLFSPNGFIADHLPRNPFVAGVAIWWRIFGSSGNDTPPSVGVLRGFTRSARFPKTIDENGNTFKRGRHVPTHSKLRINHYWSKSISELTEKKEKFSIDVAFLDHYLRWDEVLNHEDDRVMVEHLRWQKSQSRDGRNHD